MPDEIKDKPAEQAEETKPELPEEKIPESEAPKQEEAKPPEEKLPEWNAELVKQAEEYGLTPELFKEESALAKAITLFEINIGKRTLTNATPSVKEPITPNAPQERAQEKPEETFELKYDPDLVDEETAKTFDQINRKIKADAEERKRLIEKIESLDGDSRAIRQARFAAEFDGVLNSWGEEYVPLFGKGTVAELADNSEELKNRNQLIEEMGYIQAGRRALGKPELPMKTAMEKARAAAFGETSKNAIKKQIADKLKGQTKISRPTERETKQPQGEEAAKIRWEQYNKEHGIT